MLAKVAIIIPAYNAENSLEHTIKSICSQTLYEIEIWIVDDGSRDKTGEIADKLKQIDTRIHVIHQENCGCYQARLAALKLIKTPYFGFVDADDTVVSDMFEKMISVAEKYNLDVVQCDYLVNCKKNNNEANKLKLELLIKYEDVFKKVIKPLYLEGQDSAFVWNKIYRNQYDFETFDLTDKVTTYEDMIFNLQFFKSVKKMAILHEPLYNYQINENSSVKNYSLKTLHDFIECICIRKKILPYYGFNSDVYFNDKWIIRNTRNSIISAALAYAEDNLEREKKISSILSTTEICKARNRLLLKGKFGFEVLLVAIANLIPSSLVIYAIRMIARFKSIPYAQ